MKKIWNHYDPLDFDTLEQNEGEVPDPPAAPSARHKKRGVLDRLYAWIFHAEEETVDYATPVMQSASSVPAVSAPETIAVPQTISAPAGIDDTLRIQREQVQRALNDWKAATAYFESVADPELVDYAVYGMEAAQKRYIYLLRSAGREE